MNPVDGLCHWSSSALTHSPVASTVRPPEPTQFLNVDLDLRLPKSAESLRDGLRRRMHLIHDEVGDSLKSWELTRQPQSVEDAARRIIAAVESLPPKARAEWKQCKARDFNVGIRAGVTPHSQVFALSASSLLGLARLRMRLVWTVYAADLSDAREPRH